jgi:hypothetical protein
MTDFSVCAESKELDKRNVNWYILGQKDLIPAAEMCVNHIILKHGIYYFKILL